jgi:hypothetical protein
MTSPTDPIDRTPASATITIRANDGIDLIEADGSAGSAACAIKNFVERRLIGLFDLAAAGDIPGGTDVPQLLASGARHVYVLALL